jgi:hypothetical protein
MAQEAPNHYVTQFQDSVTHVYQPEGNLLAGTVTPPIKVTGKDAKFPIVGRGEATPLVRGSRGPEMNASRTMLTATLADYQANDWAWETDAEKMMVEEGPVIQKTCGMAIGRKKDLLIINEMNAQSLVTVDATNGGANAANVSPFTLAMALQVVNELDDSNANRGRRYCIMPPRAWAQFTSYKQVNSADWVGSDGLPYKTGQKWKDWNGVMWRMGPKEYFPVFSANVLDFFAWDQSAIGAITGYELRSTITWENLYSGWYHNNRFSATAKTLLPTGIIRVRFGVTSPISIN